MEILEFIILAKNVLIRFRVHNSFQNEISNTLSDISANLSIMNSFRMFQFTNNMAKKFIDLLNCETL